MTPEIYMWGPYREYLLAKHDAYVDALKQRLFPLFEEIDEEAEKFADQKYEELMSLSSWDENTDPSLIAEMAQDAAIEKYGMLDFLRREMLLGALAGLYHVWERMLRDFLDHEFRHWMDQSAIEKRAWRASIQKTFELLASFGWDVGRATFFDAIDACRLIVNVYKHGKGDSVRVLTAKYPKYLRHPLGLEMGHQFGQQLLDHESLKISEGDILRIAASFRQFWTSFPERLTFEEAEAS